MEIPDLRKGQISIGVSNRGRRKVSVIVQVFPQPSRAERCRRSLKLENTNTRSTLDPNLGQGRITRLTFGRIGPLKKSVHLLSISPSATIFPFSSIPTWALCWKLPGSGSVIWFIVGANAIVRRRTDLLHERGPELGFTRAERWRRREAM